MNLPHASAWTRPLALLLTALWSMPAVSSAQTSSVDAAHHQETPTPFVSSAGPSGRLLQRARSALNWFSPLVVPTIQSSLGANKGYLTGGPAGRIRFEVETAPPSLAPRPPSSMSQLYH